MDRSNPYAPKSLVPDRSKLPTGPDRFNPSKGSPNLPKPPPPDEDSHAKSFDLPKRPTPDFSLFRGKPRESVRELRRRLKTDPKYRNEIAAKYGKKPYDPFVDKFIEEEDKAIESFDLNKDGFVDTRIEVPSKRDAILHPGREEHFRKIHETLEEREGGISVPEIWERRRKETSREFFKRLFGIK